MVIEQDLSVYTTANTTTGWRTADVLFTVFISFKLRSDFCSKQMCTSIMLPSVSIPAYCLSVKTKVFSRLPSLLSQVPMSALSVLLYVASCYYCLAEERKCRPSNY